MEKIIADLFGLTFSSVPAPLQGDLKALKNRYLGSVGQFLSKISTLYELGGQDPDMEDLLNDEVYITTLKNQLEMAFSMSETMLKNSLKVISSTTLTYCKPESLDRVSGILKDAGFNDPKSELGKRDFQELGSRSGSSNSSSRGSASNRRRKIIKISKSDRNRAVNLTKEEEEKKREELEQKRKIAEGRQKKNKKSLAINSQSFAVPKRRLGSKKDSAAVTQPKNEQSQKTTTMTNIMMSQIDQTVPESSSSSGEEDKMQVSTIDPSRDVFKDKERADSARGIKRARGVKAHATGQGRPKVSRSILMSQIPQALDDDDSDDDSDDIEGNVKGKRRGGAAGDAIDIVTNEDSENDRGTTPSFHKPVQRVKQLIDQKKGLRAGKGKGDEKKEVKKASKKRFTLLSQINTLGDDDSDDEDSDDDQVQAVAQNTRARTRGLKRATKTATKGTKPTGGSDSKKDQKNQNRMVDVGGDDDKREEEAQDLSTDYFKINRFEIEDLKSNMEAKHVSALVVKSHDKVIVGGRWFGIWELERNDDNEFLCAKKLVNQCKRNSQSSYFYSFSPFSSPFLLIY